MRTMMCLCIAMVLAGVSGCRDASEAEPAGGVAEKPSVAYPPADTPRQLRINEYQAKLAGDVDAFLACYETHDVGREGLAAAFELSQASKAYEKKFGETFYSRPGAPFVTPAPAPLDVDNDVVLIEGDLAYMELSSGQKLDMVRRDGVWRFDSRDMLRALSAKDAMGQKSALEMTAVLRDLTARMDTPGVTAEEIGDELSRQIGVIMQARAKEMGLIPEPSDFPMIEN